jgi:hypothetical protein
MDHLLDAETGAILFREPTGMAWSASHPQAPHALPLGAAKCRRTDVLCKGRLVEALFMAEVAPESKQGSYRFLGFDGQGGLQLIGGLVIGLIALYSSYDHVNFFHSTIHLNQQWGVWLIVTSLAVVAIDAQLASRSRLGEENRRCEEALARSREANDAAEERNRADSERNRAAEARECQAEATKRQGQGIALLRSAALLSARVQLDPSELNRSRLNAFLALLAEQAFLDQQGPE